LNLIGVQRNRIVGLQAQSVAAVNNLFVVTFVIIFVHLTEIKNYKKSKVCIKFVFKVK